MAVLTQASAKMALCSGIILSCIWDVTCSAWAEPQCLSKVLGNPCMLPLPLQQHRSHTEPRDTSVLIQAQYTAFH